MSFFRGALVVAAAAIGAARAVFGFPGFSISGDALLYGELERNLAEGSGFVSRFVYPISLVFPALRTVPQPHLLYQPAYPGVLAIAFRVAGERDAVIVITNVVLSWVVLALVFVLARRLFGLGAACVATAALALDTTLASNIRNGGTEVLAMALVTGGAYLIAPPVTRMRAALAGAVFGVAYLTRPNLIVLAPLAVWPLWRLGARGAIAPLLAGAAAVAAPWMLRAWLNTGQPF